MTRPDESFVGQPIRALQTMLRTIAQTDLRQLSVVPDGVYTSQTADAVRSFQENNALPATGTADQATWEKIVEAYRPARTEAMAAQPIFITLNPGQTFRRGDRHHHISLVQAMLQLMGKVYPQFPDVGLTGSFDAATEEAVLMLQQLSNLTPTGVLDKMTWKHLVLQHALAADRMERMGETL